ncbi:MAG: T9SS type A sorting domain-containing protein [Flavobacteriales bacterium]
MNATGVSGYSLVVYNRWGNAVYIKLSTSYCNGVDTGELWAGQCNTGICNKPCVNSGDYTYILTLTSCSQQQFNYAGRIKVFAGNPNNYCLNLIPIVSGNEEISDDLYDFDFVDDSEIYLNTNENERNNGFLELKPNPAQSSFTLTYQEENIQHIKIKIIDMRRSCVYEHTVNNIAGSLTQQIDVAHLSSGIYFVLVENEYNEIKRARLVVQ